MRRRESTARLSMRLRRVREDRGGTALHHESNNQRGACVRHPRDRADAAAQLQLGSTDGSRRRALCADGTHAREHTHKRTSIGIRWMGATFFVSLQRSVLGVVPSSQLGARPMTPHRMRAPAWPVVFESSKPPAQRKRTRTRTRTRTQPLAPPLDGRRPARARTLAKVVGVGVNDDRAAHDAVGAEERQLAVGDVEAADAVVADRDVAEVADVAVLVLGRAVGLVGRVKVRARRRAAVGGVAEGVDVEAVEAWREATPRAREYGEPARPGERRATTYQPRGRAPRHGLRRGRAPRLA